MHINIHFDTPSFFYLATVLLSVNEDFSKPAALEANEGV